MRLFERPQGPDDGDDAAGGGAGGAAGDAQGAAQVGNADAAGAGAGTGSGSGAGDAGAAKGYWPDDWLSRVSKGDEKVAKQLGRYASPEDLSNAYIALRRRMDSGEFKSSLPQQPTADELVAWRKENGIPEKPEGYDLKFASGLVIGAADKPYIDDFLKSAHAANMTPEQVKAGIEWWGQNKERQAQAIADKDEADRTKNLDTLNQEWGGNFRRNVNLIESYLSAFPEGVRDAIKSARLPDGTALFNHPDVLRGFVSKALEINPAGVVVPAAGGDIGKSLVDEYKAITKTMQENRPAYNKDAQMQERYRVLVDAMVKHGLMSESGQLIEQSRRAA